MALMRSSPALIETGLCCLGAARLQDLVGVGQLAETDNQHKRHSGISEVYREVSLVVRWRADANQVEVAVGQVAGPIRQAGMRTTTR